MQTIDYTFSTPQQNLALDEALLDLCEEGFGHEILRFWESEEYFIVLGYSNKVNLEVNLTACQTRNFPVLRRSSGGGTVVQGPGCLNYSLILKIDSSPALKSITGTHRYILTQHQRALEKILGESIEISGISDLTKDKLKFSGNAQRRKRNFLLFHGTFLYDFDIAVISSFLHHPSQEPCYRNKRAHDEFLCNIKLPSCTIKNVLRTTWGATQDFAMVPYKKIEQLVEEQYASQKWIFRL